jgi:transcription elongation factor GreB
MSKAFTSEETPETELLGRSPPRLAPGEVRYVTPDGLASLRAALGRIEAERAAAATELAEPARAARLAQLDQRAALLGGTLAALTVLGPEAIPAGQVGFGSWVVVEDEDGARSTWRIVGPDEADAKHGLVSADAPLARALLGKAAGEAVLVRRPKGEVELTIVLVSATRPAS